MTDAAGASVSLDDSERAALIEQLARQRAGWGLADAPEGFEAHRRSPACGDDVRVRVSLDGTFVRGVRWEGHGCVVSTAAASALAILSDGVELSEWRRMIDLHIAAVQPDGLPVAELGDAEVFAGIGRFPLRAGCATLAWRAALDAVEGR